MSYVHTTKFYPAFDDQVNGCAHKRKGDHGRGSVRIVMASVRDRTAASLEFSSGWHLPETYEKGTNIYGGRVDWRELPHPRSSVLGLHSPVPLLDGDLGEGPDCLFTGGVCFADVTYTGSDEGLDLLLREGSKGVFRWLDGWVDSVIERQGPR